MIPKHLFVYAILLKRLFTPVRSNSKGFDTKESLNEVSTSPLERNIFDVKKSIQMPEKNSWLVRAQENIVDVAKSPIKSQ